ncbi:MAG: type IX secretion system membrane protein PorP/SprF [Bacteroidetes bacterium]|nr:MAG: type IX secretion system membrane protein PorP/SprF [Bacteroidota bacterium]MBL1144602.1 type IX secretion system membrane protein PorP/SprF [Bacteroidota bacterium]MCB0802291.1 type IX secretion system membrane protein PorP/SprF [Flavobacteriales bacterium]NOG57397.1 type IX secretion system membrane protein PorP/SprF [Bacteroidota bacterium]
MKKQIAFLLFLIVSVSSIAQDMQFSQFYAAPLYVNPGFTGSTIEHRLTMNYRHQWPNIPGAFEAYHASYEYNASEINSGFGLIMNREDVGSFGLKTNLAALSYAYRFQLQRKLYLMPGLKLGYAIRSIDYSRLTFNDQLESNNSVTLDEKAFGNESVAYPDVSSGILLYGENYWFGVSLNHMNEPNQSLLTDGGESILPMKLSVQGGYKFELSGPVKKRLSAKDITTAINYKAQGLYDQFDIGAYYNHTPFVFGFWYRGIPGLKSYEPGIQNNDAVIVLVGYSVPDRNLRIGYSYDVTISRLAANTGGAHELSLIYEVASPRKKRKSRRFLVPCAKF